MKENLCTKYTPFTYKYIILNKNPPITKQNLRIFFFIIDRVECTCFLAVAQEIGAHIPVGGMAEIMKCMVEEAPKVILEIRI